MQVALQPRGMGGGLQIRRGSVRRVCDGRAGRSWQGGVARGRFRVSAVPVRSAGTAAALATAMRAALCPGAKVGTARRFAPAEYG